MPRAKIQLVVTDVLVMWDMLETELLVTVFATAFFFTLKGFMLSLDIDECTNSGMCSPGLNCYNLPGTYICATCPPGFIGNGVICVGK